MPENLLSLGFSPHLMDGGKSFSPDFYKKAIAGMNSHEYGHGVFHESMKKYGDIVTEKFGRMYEQRREKLLSFIKQAKTELQELKNSTDFENMNKIEERKKTVSGRLDFLRSKGNKRSDFFDLVFHEFYADVVEVVRSRNLESVSDGTLIVYENPKAFVDSDHPHHGWFRSFDETRSQRVMEMMGKDARSFISPHNILSKSRGYLGKKYLVQIKTATDVERTNILEKTFAATLLAMSSRYDETVDEYKIDGLDDIIKKVSSGANFDLEPVNKILQEKLDCVFKLEKTSMEQMIAACK